MATLLVDDGLENSLDAYWNESTGPDSYPTSSPSPAVGTYSALSEFTTDESGPFYVRKTASFDKSEITVAFHMWVNSTFDWPQNLKCFRAYDETGPQVNFLVNSSGTEYQFTVDCTSGNCGSTISINDTGGTPVKNQWVEIYIYIKLNTASSSDGEYEVIVDGTSLFSDTGVSLRGTSSANFDGIWIGGNYSNGGTDPATTSTRAFDRIRVWEGDARPSLGASGTAAPTAPSATAAATGTITAAASGLDLGVNFRATSGYVTDGAGETYCLNEAYPVSRADGTFGWESGTPPDGARDRDSGVTARLAGVNFVSNSGTQYTFRFDLDATGTHEIHLALGDTGGTQGYQYVQFQDNTTAFATILKATGTNVDEFFDATGTKYSEANWPGSETAISHTFTSTILRVIVGSPDSQSNATTLAHLRVVEIGSSGPSIPVVVAMRRMLGFS